MICVRCESYYEAIKVESYKFQDKPSSEAIGDSFDLLIPDLSGATFNNTPKPKPTLSELSV